MPRHFGILIPSTNTTCEIEFSLVSTRLAVALTSTLSETEPTCIVTLI